MTPVTFIYGRCTFVNSAKKQLKLKYFSMFYSIFLKCQGGLAPMHTLFFLSVPTFFFSFYYYLSWINFKTFLDLFILYYVYECFGLICLCATHECLTPPEIRRELELAPQELELHMVMSHCVRAANWKPVLWKSKLQLQIMKRLIFSYLMILNEFQMRCDHAFIRMTKINNNTMYIRTRDTS